MPRHRWCSALLATPRRPPTASICQLAECTPTGSLAKSRPCAARRRVGWPADGGSGA